jgi:hypothetical protein
MRPNKNSSRSAGYRASPRIGPVGSIGPNVRATPASVRPRGLLPLNFCRSTDCAQVFGLLIRGRE